MIYPKPLEEMRQVLEMAEQGWRLVRKLDRWAVSTETPETTLQRIINEWQAAIAERGRSNA